MLIKNPYEGTIKNIPTRQKKFSFFFKTLLTLSYQNGTLSLRPTP
jgi:hypothetical protein